MGIMKGIMEINKAVDRAGGGNTEGGPKVRWLKLEDNEKIKARMINELDADSPNYDPKRDLAIVVSEHSNPEDYRKKAVCTQDVDGRCFGCEQYRKETKESRGTGPSWRPKLRFYTNLLVNDGKEDPYVAVWSQGVGKQSAFGTIREYFADTGSISNVVWSMKRQGTGTNTTYVMLPLAPDTEPFDWSGVEPYDLAKVVREVPYAEQQDFYYGFDANPADTASTTNLDWI